MKYHQQELKMKFSSALTGIALSWLFSLSANANLAIDINTQTLDPSIRKEGGVIGVIKSLKNTGNEAQAVKVYSYLVYPDGQIYVDSLPTEFDLNPDESYSDGNVLLNIPSTFPRGEYRYYYNVYNQATSEIFSDFVTFEKKSQVIDVSVNGTIACGTDMTGSLCWNLESGDTFQPTPEPIFDINDIEINENGGCAIVNQDVKCWKTSHSSTGVTASWNLPTRVTFNKPEKIFINKTADQACTINDGEILCWGANGAWGTSNAYVAPPVYSTLRNPGNIQIGFYTACIRHDDGVDCWGAKKVYNKPSLVEQTPTITNPTHLAVAYKYACASGDEGIQCWGTLPVHLSKPELQPHTRLRATPSFINSLDEKGLFFWNTPYPRYFDFPLPELQNPIKFDFDTFSACALDDRGIICFGRKGTEADSVPYRFMY